MEAQYTKRRVEISKFLYVAIMATTYILSLLA